MEMQLVEKKLLKLLTEPDYRQELIRKGKKRADLFSDVERLKTLELIFKQFENKHSLWTFD